MVDRCLQALDPFLLLNPCHAWFSFSEECLLMLALREVLQLVISGPFLLGPPKIRRQRLGPLQEQERESRTVIPVTSS